MVSRENIQGELAWVSISAEIIVYCISLEHHPATLVDVALTTKLLTIVFAFELEEGGVLFPVKLFLLAADLGGLERICCTRPLQEECSQSGGALEQCSKYFL